VSNNATQTNRIDKLLSEMLHDISIAEANIPLRIKQAERVKKKQSKPLLKKYQVNYLERVNSNDKAAVIPTRRSNLQRWIKRAVHSSYLKLALSFAIVLGIVSR